MWRIVWVTRHIQYLSVMKVRTVRQIKQQQRHQRQQGIQQHLHINIFFIFIHINKSFCMKMVAHFEEGIFKHWKDIKQLSPNKQNRADTIEEEAKKKKTKSMKKQTIWISNKIIWNKFLIAVFVSISKLVWPGCVLNSKL